MSSPVGNQTTNFSVGSASQIYIPISTLHQTGKKRRAKFRTELPAGFQFHDRMRCFERNCPEAYEFLSRHYKSKFFFKVEDNERYLKLFKSYRIISENGTVRSRVVKYLNLLASIGQEISKLTIREISRPPIQKILNPAILSKL